MATNEIRGEWVVGLNPDDRMPNDWLRMVARVFAAYRNQPLKESIVAYIDGLEVNLISHVNNKAIVKISPGQSFIDDQFIGFTEDSIFEFDSTWLNDVNTYCIVLFYRWVNQMPPEEPHFQLVKLENINPEEMLCLAKVTCTFNQQGSCDLNIINDKNAWYEEMILAASGNTEVDGPEKLPYAVLIKGKDNGAFPEDPLNPDEEGTLDIGWAVDFHNYVGNQVNYNTRLHTDKINNGELFINSGKILAEINPDNPNLINDPIDSGDVYTSFNNNIVLQDIYYENEPNKNLNSNSRKACFTLKSENVDQFGLSTSNAASLCFDGINNSLNFTNREHFNLESSVLNKLTLTEIPNYVTINDFPIWHSGNLESTGQNIMFVGYHNGQPLLRPNGDPLENGDVYYDTALSSFFYFKIDAWTAIGTGGGYGITGSLVQYEFNAADGQTDFVAPNNPSFIYVSVSGIELDSSEFDTDGTNVMLHTPTNLGDIVKIYSADATDINIQDLNNVEITTPTDGQILKYDAINHIWKNYNYDPIETDFDVTGTQDTFDVIGYEFTSIEVYTDGIRNRSSEFTWSVGGSNTNIIFNTPRTDGTWVLIVGR